MKALGFARLCWTIAALAIAAQAAADADTIHFKAVNDPNAASSQGGTAVNAINLFGAVVGNFVDAAGAHHAMVGTPPYSKSSFTTIDGPGSLQGTNAWGINLEGTITGWYIDANSVLHGFVSDPPYATVATIDAPAACSSGAVCSGLGTQPFSINLEGTITGYYCDADVVAHGFVSHRPYTTFKTIDAPDACSSGPACAGFGLGTYVLNNSLNDLGAITGVYYDANGVGHGFVSRPPYKTFNTFDAPGACTSGLTCNVNFNGTQPSSINLWGAITGYYFDANAVAHGFMSHPPYTTFKTLDAPGACSGVPACVGFGTKPQSINLDGTITGFFEDENVVHHGLLSDPPYTTVTKFDAPGACSSGPACAFQGTVAEANDVVGGVAGFDINSPGRQGFVGHQDE